MSIVGRAWTTATVISRGEAFEKLRHAHILTVLDADDIFRAFGLSSVAVAFNLELYYHPRYASCGGYTAGSGDPEHLTSRQRLLLVRILNCVLFQEAYAPPQKN